MTRATPTNDELDTLYARYVGDMLTGIKTARQWIHDEEGMTMGKIIDHSRGSYRRTHGGGERAVIFVDCGDA